MKTGKGKGLAAASLLGFAAVAALSGDASAAMVSISRIITNTTTTTQTYQFSESLYAGENFSSVGAFGSMSLVLTDLNRNGATVSSDAGALYSGWINNVKVNSFMLGSSLTQYQLSAPSRGQASDAGEFGNPIPVSLGRGLVATDLMQIRFNFTLSAGDQLAFSGVFNLAAVPAPSGAAVALLGSVVRRERRRPTASGR